jgi:hypothetical protein
VNYPKRLIEVDLPIKRISANARRDKSIRHGRMSTLQVWWARRPLAACRTVNRGFDLISRKPHPEDPKTAIDVRFIEVKGRSDTGDIALTTNEYNTAKRLKKDYYLYIVMHCATAPSLNIFQDPAILDWQPIVKVEHYRLRQDSVKAPAELKEEPSPYKL